MASWRRGIIERFLLPSAPRVQTLDSFMHTAKEIMPGIPDSAVRCIVDDLEDILFRKVPGDILLNLKAFPEPTYGDAIPLIAKGAVVSLQTVLGDCGMLNGYTPNYYCVQPASKMGGKWETKMDLGAVRIDCIAIPDEVLKVGPESRRLEYGFHYPRATPEAALVHWMYLAHLSDIHFPEPSTEADISSFDIEILELLASPLNLWEAIQEWMQRVSDWEKHEDRFG